jgi:hypothetical protein
MVTRYGLGGLRIESRCGGGRFSAPVHTGSQAHPASCAIGTVCLFAGVTRLRVVLTINPLLVPKLRMGWSYTSAPPPPCAGIVMSLGDLYRYQHNSIYVIKLISYVLNLELITRFVCTRVKTSLNHWNGGCVNSEIIWTWRIDKTLAPPCIKP